MLRADTGQTQTQICRELGCSAVTARYWIGMARTGNAHLWNQQSVGRPRQVDQAFLDRLKELVCQSPREVGYPFSRWTGQWLSKHLHQELGIKVSNRYINSLLKKMGLSTRQSLSSLPLAKSPQTSHRIAIQDIRSDAVPSPNRIGIQ
ncbi:helix-turn-helix domain-containing protein [Lyngbya confervoides]